MGNKSKYKFLPGTWVERELFESKAFLSLRGAASQVLILFLSKRQFDKVGRRGKEKRICTNRDSISFTYIEAEKKYGITKSRFSRALNELMAKGFISRIHQGGAWQRDKSIYALSDNWKQWSDGVVFENRKKENVERGFCRPQKKSTSKVVPIHSNENVPLKVGLG
jgi:hypothetical protein